MEFMEKVWLWVCLETQLRREYTSVMIVPTGIGAAIGGYAGDALPVARALSSVVDCLITHPNVCSNVLCLYDLSFFFLGFDNFSVLD